MQQRPDYRTRVDSFNGHEAQAMQTRDELQARGVSPQTPNFPVSNMLNSPAAISTLAEGDMQALYQKIMQMPDGPEKAMLLQQIQQRLQAQQGNVVSQILGGMFGGQ